LRDLCGRADVCRPVHHRADRLRADAPAQRDRAFRHSVEGALRRTSPTGLAIARPVRMVACSASCAGDRQSDPAAIGVDRLSNPARELRGACRQKFRKIVSSSDTQSGHVRNFRTQTRTPRITATVLPRPSTSEIPITSFTNASTTKAMSALQTNDGGPLDE
jgi:hypothetical protein